MNVFTVKELEQIQVLLGNNKGLYDKIINRNSENLLPCQRAVLKKRRSVNEEVYYCAVEDKYFHISMFDCHGIDDFDMIRQFRLSRLCQENCKYYR